MSTSRLSESNATQPNASHLTASGASQPAASHPIPSAPHPTVGSATQPARSHLAAGGAPQPAALSEATRSFILMTELHYRHPIGLDRLHIGRLHLARPPAIREDEVASSLQPSVAPGTTDVQAPFENQGRGFVHGHGKGHDCVGPSVEWLRCVFKAGQHD